MAAPETPFGEKFTKSCRSVSGKDPNVAYRELMLDIRMGGPVYERLRRRMSQAMEKSGQKRVRRAAQLSPREQQVMILVSQGDNRQEIAEKLGISVETVKTHIQHILRKLDARNARHAAVVCVLFGLFEQGEAE